MSGFPVLLYLGSETHITGSLPPSPYVRRPQKDLDLLDPESPHHRQSPSSWPSSLQSSGSTGLLFISHQSVGFAVSAPGDYSRPCNSCMVSTRGSASVVCSSCCSLCCSLMYFQEIVLEKITDGANMKAGAVLLSLAVMFFRQASGRLWSASHPSPSSARWLSGQEVVQV